MIRRQKAWRFVIGSGLVAVAALAACGLDVTGQVSDVEAGAGDTGSGREASLPRNDYDANPSDAPNDGDVQPCGNTSIDPNHCGECGHACGAGRACGGSVCEPDTLRTGLNDPFAVARVDGTLFVAERTGGRIYRVELDAGAPAPPDPLYVTNQSPRAIAANRDRIYWVDQGNLNFVLADGGGARTSVGLGNIGTALLLNEDGVYYNDNGGGRVLRRNRALDAENTIANQPSARPFGLVGDARHVYWTNDVPDGSVTRYSRDAGTGQDFAANEDNPSSMAIGPERVFWTTPTSIRFAPLDRSTLAADLFANRTAPTSLVRSGAYLYWLEPSRGWLVRGNTDGTGSPLVLAVDPSTSTSTSERLTTGIAADDRFVYWVSPANGTLKRVPR